VAEVDLSTLLEANQPDLSKIEAQLKKTAALQGELRFARIKTLEQGRAVLSQEQWQKFESLAPGMGPMGPYGRPWQQGQLGPGPYGAPGMMGGYGGPGGMMGGYVPGGGYGPGGMMGGYGPGGMMGGGPYGEYGNRQFSSKGEQIYFTGVSQKDGYIPRVGGPPWAQRVGCVACHGPNGRGGVPVMMGTAIPADIQYKALLAHHYTNATIERAITQGLDEDGKSLDWTMPRWKMSEEDLSDILAFLKTLR
jgi:cytochrome c oxidase subunit 2